LSQNYKALLQAILGLLFVGFGIYFIKKEQVEMGRVKDSLLLADPVWIAIGVVLLVLFVWIQGLMYQQSFRAIHERIHIGTAMGLFLKRNLISVFLPAGVLTNMLFFNKSIEQKEGVSRSQIYFASSIFSFCSIGSAVIIGVPSLFWLLLKGTATTDMVWGIVLTTILLLGLVYLVVNLVRKGKVYRWIEYKFPAVIQSLSELFNQSFNQRRIIAVLALSVVIELIGIAHLYISVKALGGTPTLAMAFIGYAIVLLLLMSSPFLRGIGAVEVALTFALVSFGMSHVLAISIAFLFRFFEFWAILIVGLIAIISQKHNVLLRVFPAFLLFLLGIVNIVSGITPALPHRLVALQDVIPLEAIHASVWLVVFSGAFMLAVSVFLIRGLRNAWISAVTLSALSLVFHLTKGFDWEEALFALVTLAVLVYQRKQYFIQTDIRFARKSFLPLTAAFVAIIAFGTIGFYLLDEKHFHVNFTLIQSFKESLSVFFLLNNDLQPATHIAREFLFGLNLSGGITMATLAYLLFRPFIHHPATTAEEDLQKAKTLVEKYGNSALDYFKTYSDKKFWFSEDGEGFVAFKTTGNYAVVLENPVCKDEESFLKIISAFDNYCRKNGLRSAYYRIPEHSKHLYENAGKKLMAIGEVAVAGLEDWNLAGGERRPLRNAINKLTKQGNTFRVNQAPQKDAFLQQLKATSHEWLKDYDRTELVFSQGLFDETELKQQVILSVENPEGKVVGFVNLIPDRVEGEANFDLMRKTHDAPNGTMDYLFAMMFEYLKSAGYKTCNLGMVPMSGIAKPDNMQERVIKLAYEKLKHFGHYRSLRDYKEKFNPQWEMMYMAYGAPFDLIYLPRALEEIIEP